MLLRDLFLARAEEMPGKTALRRGSERIDLQGLADTVRKTAGGFVELGLRSGDRVGIYLNKRIEAVASYFAAGNASGVFVPVNPSLKAPEVAHILRDCDAKILIATRPRLRCLATNLRSARQSAR
jgi:acyl-CoA synthetase (AMP-forming)/AMP-acid ligase II